MRKHEYEMDRVPARAGKLISVTCNCCGKEMLVENGILKEGCFRGQNQFGYFSKRDGEAHSFDLCESCYEKITKNWKILPEVREASELI